MGLEWLKRFQKGESLADIQKDYTEHDDGIDWDLVAQDRQNQFANLNRADEDVLITRFRASLDSASTTYPGYQSGGKPSEPALGFAMIQNIMEQRGVFNRHPELLEELKRVQSLK